MPKSPDVRVAVTEITISSGRRSSVTVDIDGQTVQIPVDPEVRAYFQEQFVRPNPTAHQRRRFATLMTLIRAAYKKGLRDGARR